MVYNLYHIVIYMLFIIFCHSIFTRVYKAKGVLFRTVLRLLKFAVLMKKRAHSLNLKAFEQIFMVVMVFFRILDPNPHHRVTRNQGIRLLGHRTRRNYGDR